jgi:phenylacetic acid degradation protein
VKEVSDEMLTWKTKGTALYQALPAEMYDTWKPCEPLAEVEPQRPSQEKLFETWTSIKKND